MSKKIWYVLIGTLMIAATLLSACGPASTPVATQPPATEAPKPTETPKPTEAPPTQAAVRHLQIYHWWTAPGEREAADAMFAALKAAYPDIQVDENRALGAAVSISESCFNHGSRPATTRIRSRPWVARN